MTTTPALVRHNSFLQEGTAGSTLIAAFANREDAAQAALDLVACARPVSIDLLDREAIRAICVFAELDPWSDGGAILVVTLSVDLSAAESDRAQAMCRAHGVVALQVCPETSTARAVTTIVRSARAALASCGSGLPYEVIVPVSSLPRLLQGLTAIETRFGIQIGLIAHPGEGRVAPFVIGTDADSTAALAAIAALALSIELSPFA